MGRELVLDNVSLSIRAGDVVVVRGRSGVGKTTLARIASLLEVPDGGSVFFMGHDCTKASDLRRSAFRLKYVGYVDQFFKLVSGMSVLENVEVPLKLLGTPKEVRRKRVMEVLSALGLKDKAFSFPEELSGGERQRVAIARALVKQPALLVLDEPFSNLDEHSELNIMNLLKELAAEGVGVLITTTDLHKPVDATKDFMLLNKKLVHTTRKGAYNSK